VRQSARIRGPAEERVLLVPQELTDGRRVTRHDRGAHGHALVDLVGDHASGLGRVAEDPQAGSGTRDRGSELVWLHPAVMLEIVELELLDPAYDVTFELAPSDEHESDIGAP